MIWNVSVDGKYGVTEASLFLLSTVKKHEEWCAGFHVVLVQNTKKLAAKPLL